MMPAQIEQEACDRIGIQYKPVPADGKPHNTAAIGKSAGNTSGRIKKFTDLTGGIVFNNIDGTHLLFWYGATMPNVTPADRAAQAARIAREKQELEAAHLQCRISSLKHWETVAREEIPADHPYLVAKGIRPFGIRWQSSGNLLVVPVVDINGTIHGLQFISGNCTKKFKTGTVKTGHFFKIGTSKDQTIIICEGYATGATIHQATGHAVVIAFDAGNLLSVAQVLRAKFPHMKIIIAADSDAVGVAKGTAAAKAVNGLLAIPAFQEVCHD